MTNICDMILVFTIGFVIGSILITIIAYGLLHENDKYISAIKKQSEGFEKELKRERAINNELLK